MKIQVPCPTLGRIVIYTRENGGELPGVIVRLDGYGLKLHLLGTLNPNVEEVHFYPTAKPGHWRYPDRSEATFEFEA